MGSDSSSSAGVVPVLADPRRPANNARFVYLDPAAREFFADWDRAADDIAAMLRSEAGCNPHDKQLIELIGELSTQSHEFRTRWAAHNVRFHRTGHKRIHHPVVGTLDLDFEAMEFPAHPGLTLLAYTAAAGTPAGDSLEMLASWAATAERTGNLSAGVQASAGPDLGGAPGRGEQRDYPRHRRLPAPQKSSELAAADRPDQSADGCLGLRLSGDLR
jgi:hypothetical protein